MAPEEQQHPTNPLTRFLEAQGVVILDGGFATELERRGADLRDPLWSAKLLLDDPALIRLLHEGYFAAGADVAVTASYQASIEGFAHRGLDAAAARRLMAQSVELARQARERFWQVAGEQAGRLWPLVAGSVGPYGAALTDGSEYRGGYGVSEQELTDFHGPRLEALVEAGADLLALETLPSPDEAVVLLKLVAEWPAMPVWVSFSCRDETRVSEGQPVQEAIAAVAEHSQVVAVGVNCVPPTLVEPLLRLAGGVTAKPLVAYPNSGEAWDAEGRRWVGEPEAFDFGQAARRWHEVGARLIGGCCRTTPEIIRAIRAALAGRMNPAPTGS